MKKNKKSSYEKPISTSLEFEDAVRGILSVKPKIKNKDSKKTKGKKILDN